MGLEKITEALFLNGYFMIGWSGIAVGLFAAGLACAVARNTLRSHNNLTRVIGCMFLSSAALMAFLTIGFAGSILKFSLFFWAMYRSALLVVMIWKCAAIWRLYCAVG